MHIVRLYISTPYTLLCFVHIYLVPDKVWRINLDAAAEARDASSFDTDERWWDQVDLSKLILASNKLVSVSDDIKLLTALTVLDVRITTNIASRVIHCCDKLVVEMYFKVF